MEPKQGRLGLFVSYNEGKNGAIRDAVDVSNAQEYVVWLERARVKTKRLSYPTTILVKIAGEDRYYRGDLKDIKRAEEVDKESIFTDLVHRPEIWHRIDKEDYSDFETVLYIARLKQVERPPGIAKEDAPQRPYYIDESVLLGLDTLSLPQQAVPLPEEVSSDEDMIEGAVCQVTINAYERSPAARKICIDHYGPTCVVCGFNFGAKYGELADGFIHVHHLKPLSEIGKSYRVDPVADLRPVCPNCHAIIHLGRATRSIEEVKDILR